MRARLLYCILLSSMYLASVAQVLAGDVTLRMKGGSFAIEGALVSYDKRTWVIVSPALGRLSLDASRYDCVAGSCSDQPIAAPAADGIPISTWAGEAAIGAEVIPKLIEAYAASKGARAELHIGSDPKNLEFVLMAREGAPLGRVIVERQGEPQGFAGLASGRADVVWSTRAILPEEEQKLADAGIPGMRRPSNQFVWGLDALVVLVSKDNSVVSLSLDNIAKIFSGAIKDWSELDLPPGKINVYAPSVEMGTWSHFEAVVLKPRGLEITKDATRLSFAAEWADRVAADPNGIGLSTVAFVRRAKAINIEMPCGIVVQPSSFSAKTEEYPLTRRLYFYTRGRPGNELTEGLLSVALSPQMQPLLKEARFVDQDPELLAFTAQGSRIATALNAPAEDFDAPLVSKLIEDLRKAQRLSLTFRFGTGAIQLDSRGMSDIARLATLVASPEMNGRSFMLIGFSDSAGRFSTNLGIAKRRAQLVYGALSKMLGKAPPNNVSIVEAAYGELAPVACNDVEDGRALNRRVEVWIK